MLLWAFPYEEYNSLMDEVKIEYDVHIAANGGVWIEDCWGLFSACKAMKEIHFNESFYTDLAVDMERMFEGCYNLESLDLSSLDTSNVINMRSMFRDCDSLESLNLGTWETEQVIHYEDFMDTDSYNGQPWENLFE